ncbi:hypothetical protein FDP41_003467 [Naegleria fowleri]|uniref:Uncharacterized protein n=1 Tax=Naegleria fowleri TaxID=5763 RepID=A0A6A5BVV8_NAEFO|nr:uncharacterized protein FDP41_003467 [Naegleria fowleri]KAF0977475.1 hypothetical protein FDP41_003467 [Naegleria fowleri]
MIKVKAPLPFLKELNCELMDVPGLNSGSHSKIFERLALKAGKLSDRILIFPNNMISEFPTDYFELMGRIFADKDIQRNPKTFCYCFGGITINEEKASKEFLGCLSKKKRQKFEKTFRKYLSDFFDYKFDDTPNEKPVNGQVEFVESKKRMLEFLNDQFMIIPIPNTKYVQFEREFHYTRSSERH